MLAQTLPEADPVTPAANEVAAPSSDQVPVDAFGTRFEARLAFDRLVGDRHYRDALPLGKRMVDLTEQEFGKHSKETGDAYADLASAERLAGEHDDAEKNFLHAIDVYRAVDGPFTPLAIDALTGLGDNYEDTQDYAKAVSAYSEARTVNRRTYGLLSESQVPLIDRLSKSLLELNRPEEAEQQQLQALRLTERTYPEESEQGLAGIYKYAQWLAESGRFQEARDQYERALRIIRDHFGKQDVRQVDPLDAIGNTFRNQRVLDPQGSSSLQEALDLLNAQPNPDALKLAGVLRDVGDWQVAFSKVPYDGAEYRRAWTLLGNVEDGARLRQEWFKGPNYVLREPISMRLVTEDPNAPSGHVLAKFDLDTSGVPDNVAIVESDPPGVKDDAIVRHLRRSRFRPQMVDGEIVPAQGLALQFNYRYDSDALEQSKHGKRADSSN